MINLSDRQSVILKSIVEEFIETANPVGSETLEKKHGLGVCPATIRNEMVKLTEEGFLKKVHTSSGRMPTPMALKYYVNNLMKQENLSLTEEVAMKEKVWDYREKFEKLLQEATRELAHRSKMLSLATSDQGELYSSGVSNILESPEFYDIDLTKTILSYLDSFDYWENLIEKALDSNEPFHLILGDELGREILAPCGFLYARYKAGPRSGIIGVVGPARVKYHRVIPLVEYFGNLISEISQNW